LPHTSISGEEARQRMGKSEVARVEWNEIPSPLEEGTCSTVTAPEEVPVNTYPSLILAIPHAYGGSNIHICTQTHRYTYLYN
jgi:hypothetical protein